MKLNPGKLKLELYCKGVKIDDSCELEKDAQPIQRTRAGLGSGLEVILPQGLLANIPVLEPFVKDTPFSLAKRQGNYFVLREGEAVCRVKLPSQPGWYQAKTSSGTVMSRVGVLQGTYLGVYPTKICSYWDDEPKRNCKFCSTGLNIGRYEQEEKSVEDVVETALAAKRESKITFVHFNAGYYGGDELLAVEPYVKAVKQRTGLLVGVQVPPSKKLEQYDRLVKSGADHFSFCFELWNREKFTEVCPGKQDTLTQEAFYEAMKHTAKLMGVGKNSGEIIAGLEPLEDTYRALDFITGVGCFPTVCVFRPLVDTDYEKVPSPGYEEMLKVFNYMYRACRDKSIPTGIAPNVRVSIVVLPYEGRYFAEGWGLKDIWYSLKLFLMRAVFRSYFRLKMLFRR